MFTSQPDLPVPQTEAPNWKDILKDEREKDYFKQILSFIEKERSLGKTIYPKNSDIFNALAYTHFEELRVVLLGQDPYHGPNQAHGLCFFCEARCGLSAFS